MSHAVKAQEPKSPAKKTYVTPRLVTHGDVAHLTNHYQKPRHCGNGPESELS